MGQKFVIDPSITINQYIKESEELLKCELNIKEFIRYETGS